MNRRWMDDATLELFRPVSNGSPWVVTCESCQVACTDVPAPVRNWHYVYWLCPDCTAEAMRLAVIPDVSA